MNQGLWLRTPVHYREVLAVVGKPPDNQPTAWYRPLAGETIEAVEVTTTSGGLFYLDNRQGEAVKALQTKIGDPVPGTAMFAATAVESAEDPPTIPVGETIIPQPPAADPSKGIQGELPVAPHAPTREIPQPPTNVAEPMHVHPSKEIPQPIAGQPAPTAEERLAMLRAQIEELSAEIGAEKAAAQELVEAEEAEAKPKRRSRKSTKKSADDPTDEAEATS